MSGMNYWTTMRRRRISRRTMLGASAKAGVGAAGLALVGCGDDDDDDAAAPAAAEAPAEEQAEEQAQAQAEEQAEAQAQAADEPAEEEAEEQAVSAFAGIDLEATIRTTAAADNGGLDQLRAGSHTNYISHQCVHDNGIWLEPDTNEVYGHLVTPEWVDDVTMTAAVTPAPFHDGSIFSAVDAKFTHDRAGNIAEYHNGGETTDNPAGWTSARTTYGAQNWARNEAVDDRTWLVELNAPDAGFLVVSLTGAVVMISRAYTERVVTPRWTAPPWAPAPTASSVTPTMRTSSSSAMTSTSTRWTTR